MYRYKIIHAPGKSNIMKITSRDPVREPDENQSTLWETGIASYACHQAEGINAVDWRGVQHQA